MKLDALQAAHPERAEAVLVLQAPEAALDRAPAEVWRGDGPSEGVGLTTDAGFVVRFDPESGEVVGVTVLDYMSCWADHDVLILKLPALGEAQNGDTGRTHRVLATCA